MGKVYIRKLQKVGSSSYSLVLPKGWINRLHIGPQDSLLVEDDVDELVIKPASKSAEAQDIMIELDVTSSYD